MNSRLLNAIRSAGLASALLVTMSAVGAAQRPASAGKPASRPEPAAKAAPQARQGPEHPSNLSKGEIKNFSGVAGRMNMTTEALADAYKVALLANPKLSHGRFVAAHMVARNLSRRNTGITTQAILDGLASGKSMGQTLKGLGLSSDEVKSARKAAKRETREAKAEHKKDMR